MRAVSLSSVLIATALGLVSPRLASADEAPRPAKTAPREAPDDASPDEAPAAPASAPATPVKPPSVQLIEVWQRSKQALLYDRSRGTYVVVRVGDDVGGLQVASLTRGEVVLRARGAAHREYVLFPTPLLPTDAQGAAADGDDAAADDAADTAADDGAAARPLPPAPLDPYPAGVLDPYGTEGIREVPAPSGVRAPATPGAPAAAMAPAPTATPGVTSQPTAAAAPSSPAAPVTPGPAATPGQPASPVTAATPGQPATPGAPRTPSIPVPPMPTGSSSLFVTSAPAPVRVVSAASPAPTASPVVKPVPTATPVPPTAAAVSPAMAPSSAAAPSPAAPSPAAAPAATSLLRRDLDRALSDFDALSRDVDARLAGDGATLVRVAPTSLLYRIGLRVGDRVTAVDGKPLRSLDDAAALYARLSAPAINRFSVDIARGSERVTLRVQLTK